MYIVKKAGKFASRAPWVALCVMAAVAGCASDANGVGEESDVDDEMDVDTGASTTGAIRLTSDGKSLSVDEDGAFASVGWIEANETEQPLDAGSYSFRCTGTEHPQLSGDNYNCSRGRLCATTPFHRRATASVDRDAGGRSIANGRGALRIRRFSRQKAFWLVDAVEWVTWGGDNSGYRPVNGETPEYVEKTIHGATVFVVMPNGSEEYVGGCDGLLAPPKIVARKDNKPVTLPAPSTCRAGQCVEHGWGVSGAGLSAHVGAFGRKNVSRVRRTSKGGRVCAVTQVSGALEVERCVASSASNKGAFEVWTRFKNTRTSALSGLTFTDVYSTKFRSDLSTVGSASGVSVASFAEKSAPSDPGAGAKIPSTRGTHNLRFTTTLPTLAPGAETVVHQLVAAGTTATASHLTSTLQAKGSMVVSSKRATGGTLYGEMIFDHSAGSNTAGPKCLWDLCIIEGLTAAQLAGAVIAAGAGGLLVWRLTDGRLVGPASGFRDRAAANAWLEAARAQEYEAVGASNETARSLVRALVAGNGCRPNDWRDRREAVELACKSGRALSCATEQMREACPSRMTDASRNVCCSAISRVFTNIDQCKAAREGEMRCFLPRDRGEHPTAIEQLASSRKGCIERQDTYGCR